MKLGFLGMVVTKSVSETIVNLLSWGYGVYTGI